MVFPRLQTVTLTRTVTLMEVSFVFRPRSKYFGGPQKQRCGKRTGPRVHTRRPGTPFAPTILFFWVGFDSNELFGRAYQSWPGVNPTTNMLEGPRKKVRAVHGYTPGERVTSRVSGSKLCSGFRPHLVADRDLSRPPHRRPCCGNQHRTPMRQSRVAPPRGRALSQYTRCMMHGGKQMAPSGCWPRWSLPARPARARTSGWMRHMPTSRQ